MQADTSRNPRLLCVFHALQMSLFPMAIIGLFYKRQIGMDLADIYLLQSVFGLFVALFEFPSGYLADRLGYRHTLVVAALGGSVGWALYAMASTFAGVAVAEAVLGISLSLVSGADSAMLYESLHAKGEALRFTLWSGRMKFWGQTAEGTAALSAGALYLLTPRAPFVAQSLIWIVGIWVALRLVEPQRAEPTRERGGHLHEMRVLVHTAFVADRRLRAIFLLTIVMGMSTYLPVWVITQYAALEGLPDGYQGALWAAANYAVALGALASNRSRRRLGLYLSIALCIGLVVAGYVSLALLSGTLVGFLYLLMTFARGIFAPMLSHAEQDLIPSGDRAGLISLRSLLFRVSFLVIGPLVGLAFESYGMRPVFLGLGVGFLVLGGLALLHVRRVDAAPS